MGQEKGPRLAAPELPERRDFIKISALVGAGLASGALGAAAAGQRAARVALDRARVRAGGPVRVTVEDAPEQLRAAPAHLVEVSPEGRWLGVVGTTTLRRAAGALEAVVPAPGRQGAAEVLRLVVVVVHPDLSGAGEPLVSAPLEVVCTPQRLGS